MNSPILDIKGLTVTFTKRRTLFAPGRTVRAVQEVDLQVHAGETVGLVGESGSGKTTTARAVLGLTRANGGTIRAAGFEPTSFRGAAPKAYRRAVQAVFQDPYGSLNPTMTVADILAEPLTLHSNLRGTALRQKALDLLDSVGLAEHTAERYPYELSGGQRQRVSIARAIAVDPVLIVLDEPVSALDVSVQSQVINLLDDLQEQTGVAYLLVAHDLAVVRHASERIVVMFHGRAVEEGPADRVCDDPQHPYTRALLAAVPIPNPEEQRAQRELRRAISLTPKGKASAEGCPFAPRCPLKMDVCDQVFPEWTPVEGGGRVACHAATKAPSSPLISVPLQVRS
ncbi:ABC transporter ATP-binding protein [Homoserinimonas sp. A520]